MTEDTKNQGSGCSVAADDPPIFEIENKTSSCLLDPRIVWTRGQSRVQKFLYCLGVLGIGFVVLALSILIAQQWGSSSTSSTSDSSVSSPNPPPIRDRDPSLSTRRPTSPPLPLSLSPPPTNRPSSSPPNTIAPTPTLEFQWTNHPTTNPASPVPTKQPTSGPTSRPRVPPTSPPTKQPTASPTARPSVPPTLSPTKQPTASPTESRPPTYIPGNLTTVTLGLLLSEGLDARILTTTGDKVDYYGGGKSKDKFHGQPDAGATFSDVRDENLGGWIYVSNSEIESNQGGVGALTFDKDGNLLDYQMVLEKSSMNCGGGRTPWNTWVSCEEVESTGQIYQVDPTGQREPQLMTLGSEGGRWESFSYDVRDRNQPRFYATEDHSKGTIRRFTPSGVIDWDHRPWDMLHGSGITDFLMIAPNAANNGGEFVWTDNKNSAKSNAKEFYPQTEGIDVYGSQLFFVCKRIKQLFVLNLDDGTYYNQTTVNGLFDGKPDQMQRILGDSRDLLYFTEEGGVDAGIHARDHLGRYYTVFESPMYDDETTGLAFSPDGRFMYAAYQNTGVLYAIWRNDGFPFHASHLDVKYHHNE